MRTGTLIAVIVLSTSALGCKEKRTPPELEPTKELRQGAFVVKLGGPVPLERPDGSHEAFVTLENLGTADVYVVAAGCNYDLAPGERRGCFSRNGASDATTYRLEEGNTPGTKLTLKEATITRTDSGMHFRAWVVNETPSRKQSLRVRFDVLDAKKNLVAGAETTPVKADDVAPTEESLVELDLPLAKGATGALALFNPVATGLDAHVPSIYASVLVNELHVQTDAGKRQVAATLKNTSLTPVEARADVYFKDAQNRSIKHYECLVDTKKPLAPNEAATCTMFLQTEIPAYDHLEASAPKR